MDWLKELLVSTSDGTAIGFLPKGGTTDNASLVKDKHYLRIRVNSVRLGVDRKLWTSFSPLLTVEIKGIFSDGLQSLIRVVGRNNKGDNDPIEVRNTVLLDYLPYRGDGIETTVHLYKMQSGDLAREMFDSLDKVSETISMGLLGEYLNIGKVVTAELSKLIHGDKLKPIVSVKQGIQKGDLQPGYLIYANTALSELKQFIDSFKEVSTEQLIKKAFQENRPTWDYCVLEIESDTDRGDITAQNFHRKWENDILPLIWEGDITHAKKQMSGLYKDIRLAKQLTDSDRKAMPITYRLDFDEEVKAWKELHSDTSKEFRAAGEISNIPPPASSALYDFALEKGINIQPFYQLKGRIVDYPQENRQQGSFKRTRVNDKLRFVKDVLQTDSNDISLDDIYKTVEASMSQHL